MIRINQIKTKCSHKEPDLESLIRRELRLKKSDHFSWKVLRHSVDARKKPGLFDVWSVGVNLLGPDGRENFGKEKGLAEKLRNANILYKEAVCYRFPAHEPYAKPLDERPVILGMGPCGLFCALKLAEEGYAPIILERGAPMEQRITDVENFWKSGELNPNSNIQFGEGGAGTFSDGKLTTNVRDACGRNEEVEEMFIAAGAPRDIAWENLPHIGTDELRHVIVTMRKKIISLGGEVRFGHCVKNICMSEGQKGRKCLTGIYVEHGGESYFLKTQILILAPGHSSRELIRTLYSDGIPMTQKNFAVGVRVSHPQSMINTQQYGISSEEMRYLHLPQVSYKLTARASHGRGVYSFCMCPGGYIVNASSEKGYLAVNGMSDYARDSSRANSAIVVTVGQEEFGSSDVLQGIAFQEELEKKAWDLAEGKIPVEMYPDFASCVEDPSKEKTIPVRDMTSAESEKLCLKGRASFAPVHSILPRSLAQDLTEGMKMFGRKIPGFDGSEAFVAGLESRTSSPVRITRDVSMQSVFCEGLYPCGEGAGYAGGITSAAIDGIKAAEAVARAYLPASST